MTVESGEPKSIKIVSTVKIQGIISPWHHRNSLHIPLKAGTTGVMHDDGTVLLACQDGRHSITTRNLPQAAFAIL